VADFVETRLAEGRRGILEGGSCYGCVFTGGAENSLLTFARLMKPTRAGLPLLRLGLSVVLLGWVIAKVSLVDRWSSRGSSSGDRSSGQREP
jgi:hypothetical protein